MSFVFDLRQSVYVSGPVYRAFDVAATTANTFIHSNCYVCKQVASLDFKFVGGICHQLSAQTNDTDVDENIHFIIIITNAYALHSSFE